MKANRPVLKQPTPIELIRAVLGAIRTKYCVGWSEKEWFKMRKVLRKWVVLEPATFLASGVAANGRKIHSGFTLPAARFQKILLTVVTESERMRTGEIRYLPAFLRKCVQEHFSHNWEGYYSEAKTTLATAEAALLAFKALPVVTDRTVETLAEAAKIEAAKLLQADKPKGKASAKVKLADAPKKDDGQLGFAL